MQLGDAWARPLETTWYVQSTERAEALERRLKTHLDGEDGLLIQQVETNAVLLNTALRWFRKRRQESRRRSGQCRCVPSRCNCLKPRRPERPLGPSPLPLRAATSGSWR